MTGSLWLIGFRGAGKTFVGRELSKHLGYGFLDLDEEFERHFGAILPFVEREGIQEFRLREQALLEEAARRMDKEDALLAATGGGFVDWPASREVLEKNSFPKLFLNPPAELLWERLREHPERLKIGHLSSIHSMVVLLETRRPFYEKISTAACENQDISEILQLLKSLGK